MIMMILKDILDADTDYVNLLTNHDEVNLDMIKIIEQTYIRTETRAANDTNILYHCLINFLSKVGNTKLSVWKSQYKVNRITSGDLLLKVIICEIQLYTNATLISIRTQLISLNDYIDTIWINITRSNAQVKLLLPVLSSRRESSNDLLTNIFKG